LGKVKNSFPQPKIIMKYSSLFSVLTLGLALVAGVSGCKHKSGILTPLPGSTTKLDAPLRNGPDTSLDKGNDVKTTEHPFSDNDPYHLLSNGPHNEDREKFAADTVYFETDSATIKKGEQSKLENVANYFKSNSTDVLRVEGNCDERGTEGYNLTLGDKRALAIREYLANLGVSAGRIGTLSLGEAMPADKGHSESAWKKNRRGALVLLTPK